MTSDTALESPKFIFFNSKKIFAIRTHPKQLIVYIHGTFVILKNYQYSMYIDDQLFGMSSYFKYLFRIKKYKFWAFQRRIGRHRVTPSHDFRHLYKSP